MRSFENYIFGLILALCLCSCFHTSNVGKMLDRAEMYLTTAPDSAFVALDSLDRSLLNTKELQARHALLYSQAREKVGIEVYNDSIIEERYMDKMTLIEKDNRIREIVILSLLLLAIMVLIIRYVIRKIKSRPDEKAMAVIRQRLAVLDKVIASHISSDDKFYRSSEEEIDVLMADREEFLRSTKIVFEESHPKFIAYLQDKGLTDWKIGYCCLYTLGLKGKDIGEFIQKKRHYIISHEIRQKLGLDEHDTNISIYLRDLLLDLEH